MRRGLCTFLLTSLFLWANGLTPTGAQEGVTAQIAQSLGDATEQSYLAVTDATAFTPEGGWAVADAQGYVPELIHYQTVDPTAGVLELVERPLPGTHLAGASLEPVALDDLAASLEETAGAWTTGSVDEASLSVSSLETFSALGGWALVTTSSGTRELLYYGSADGDDGALTGLVRPEREEIPVGSAIAAVDPADVFPIVVDPEPVVIPSDVIPPTTIDPAPVGGVNLEPLIPDPAPVVVDPSPVGGYDLSGVVGDPSPVTVDPPPVGGIDLDPLIPDPAPVGTDPPPVGGNNLGGLIGDPSPITVDPPNPCTLAANTAVCQPVVVATDPPPVGGNNLGGLIGDPSPITVDPPNPCTLAANTAVCQPVV
ncbi:MAG TPA: hypothetical protein VHN37_14195, partial [Actinomycetota bacterium]|nr:hypothetical protein [Actinomycetota bacterium]